MTINELHIQLDLQPENRIDILKDVAAYCGKEYLFVDSSDGHCYLFDENGNENNIKKLMKIDVNFYCSNIESIIIPNSVESIGDDAFAWCRSLKSIIIPDSVKWIGDDAFIWCKNLKSIVIPNSVEEIGNYAFSKCRSLKSIIIPDSVKSIGNRVFWSCDNLKSLTFKGKTMKQVKAMENYPFGIEDESIIRCI